MNPSCILKKALAAVFSPRTLSRALLLLAFTFLFQGCVQDKYEITVSHHDPGQAFEGTTYFQAHVFHPGYFKVLMDGEVLWNRSQNGVIQGAGIGMDIMSDGKILTMFNNSHPTIIDTETDETVWSDSAHKGHHTVAETPWGSVMTLLTENPVIDYPPWNLCPLYSDLIVEVDVPSGEILWEWHLINYLDPIAHHAEEACSNGFGVLDWSHCNTVKIVENYTYDGQTYDTVVILLSRELDTFWMIDYATGDVIWSCGQHGDFGRKEPPEEPLFNSSHEIDMMENGNFILFDNGEDRIPRVSRALEFAVDPVAGTAEEVWSWTEPDEVMFSPWGGDADRLPNGNTLVSNVQEARIVEVTPSGDKVWQMDIKHPLNPNSYTVFMADRVSE